MKERRTRPRRAAAAQDERHDACGVRERRRRSCAGPSRLARRGLGRTSPESRRRRRRRRAAAASSAAAITAAPAGARRGRGAPRGRRRGARGDALRHARALHPPRPHAALRRRVLAAGIRRVVVGARDPNPRVRGRGTARLARAGIAVEVGVEARGLRRADRRLHAASCARPAARDAQARRHARRPHRHAHRRRRAGSPDRAARALVHGLRDESDAVLVGAGTVRADDPRLTCRLRGGRDPLRVIVDGRLRTPAAARGC